MIISFSRLLGVGYRDQCVSDWGVREAGWPVCWHGAPVGAGRSYPGPPRTHRAAVLRRVGHQGSSSAGIRRTFPHDGRVVPGVVPGQKDDLASQVTAMEQFCLARGLRVLDRAADAHI